MPQKVEFSVDGLSILKLGTIMTDLRQFSLSKIEKHPDKESFRIWFNETFSYYYINSASLFIPGCGLIDNLFIVPDKSNRVMSIFIFGEMNIETLEAKLTEAFGDAKLKSQSANPGSPNRTKKLWHKNGISVYLTTAVNSKIAGISISKYTGEGISPGISIY